MIVEAKITSKGQLTVPIEIRKKLGLKPGDTVAFELEKEKKATIRPVKKDSPFAKYRGIGTPGIGPGLDNVIKAVREMRGFDPDDPSVK